MNPSVRERVKQWWFTRDLLLVNFGSGPGRVPLVMLSRRGITDVLRDGCAVSFTSGSSEQKGWAFVVHAKTPEVAKEIAAQLRRRKRHILEPLGDIACIVHRRPEVAGVPNLPRLIGGDITLARVPQQQYRRHANGAWVLGGILTEPGAPPNGGLAMSPGNSGVGGGPPSVS